MQESPSSIKGESVWFKWKQQNPRGESKDLIWLEIFIIICEFEGYENANCNEKSPVTLQMIEDMRMQFVNLYNIGFVNKLMSANVSSLRFSNFKAFDLLKSYSY